MPPSDSLYQQWKSVDSEYYLTFLPSGIILHGEDKLDAYCCSPRFFLRVGNRIYFNKVPAQTLPDNIREANCVTVKCAGFDDYWRIKTLDSKRLVIETPYQTYAYQSYP